MNQSIINRILVVDDEDVYRTMVRHYLQTAMGCHCETASDAFDALEKLRHGQFGLVVSDIRMKGKDGLELTREAKGIYPNLDFIIMTGYSGEYFYSDIINAGAADFINKPFGMEELRAKVVRISEERRILRELRETNDALEKHRFHLEELVKERTDQLSRANEELQTEILERKEAEAAIRTAKEEWERTFNTVPDLIAVMDTDYRIIRMNKALAERLSANPEINLGLPCFNCMHGKDQPLENCPYTRMLKDREQHSEEVYEDLLGGYFLVTVTPFYSPEGRLVGAIHVARDITLRKQMEDELRINQIELENRVAERTSELARSNIQLSHEIEERRRVEEALRESERFLQSSLDALSAHVAILDEHGIIISVNKAWKDFADSNGYAGQDYGVGSNYLWTCDSASGEWSEEAPAVAQGMRKVMLFEEDEFYHEYPCSSTEKKRWFVVKVTRFAGEGPLRLVTAHEDITERKLIEEQLIHDAFHDSLTALPNRALFMDRMEHVLCYSKRRKDYICAVLFLDIDHFKLINDSFGHLFGDELLVSVARRIEKCTRSSDTVARLGGDEFTILLNDLKDGHEAIRFAERLRQDLRPPFQLNGREVFINVSIGIAVSKTGHERPEELLRDADTAMYRAKALGRARHEMFDKEMHTQVVKRLQLETDLRKAIERYEFTLYYQPIIHLETNKLEGFEALIRWNHPRLGLVSPMEFIPLAEETGLIVPIGSWVLREACSRMSTWHKEYPNPSPLMISVNLSSRQLREPNLVSEIERVLNETELDVSTLKLEITESVIMENAESAADLLLKFRAMGIRLSIDDFGTGYSSLSYLRRLPVNTLKIDRSFVGNMSSEDENYEIVRAIISLAHTLGLTVIAEGPETITQVAQLRALGCDYAQGYYFGRPMSDSNAEALLRESNAATRWGNRVLLP
jgi:diguanylate cyclase (GGDEF)-like protein/PAS domain S-box-containing protein